MSEVEEKHFDPNKPLKLDRELIAAARKVELPDYNGPMDPEPVKVTPPAPEPEISQPEPITTASTPTNSVMDNVQFFNYRDLINGDAQFRTQVEPTAQTEKPQEKKVGGLRSFFNRFIRSK